MKKRILSAALSLAMLLPMMPVNALALDDSSLAGEELLVSTFSLTEDEYPYSNDELLEQYLYAPISGDNWSSTYSMVDQLTGQFVTIYGKLKTGIESIANGTSTLPVIEVKGLNLDYTQDTNNHIATLVDNENSINPNDIITALLQECPYDLYWFDKTKGASLSANISEGKITSLTYTFSVSSDYAVTGGTAFNSEKMNAAKNAVDKATSIVNREDLVGASDYERLKAYFDEICKAVSYDTLSAENKATPYGDPWQLINVFTSTGENANKVVCEGYSKAFKYLCDLTKANRLFADTDMECYLVTGNMSESGSGDSNHMWNIVHLGGGNYLVDVTNCDGDSFGKPDKLFMKKPTTVNVAGQKYTFLSQIYTFDLDQGYDVDTELTLAADSYKEVKSIAVKSGISLKTAYSAGENFDPTDLVLEVTYSDNSKAEVSYDSSTFTFENNTNLSAGQQTVKIKYCGKETSVNVTVKGKITFSEVPTSAVQLIVGGTHDLNISALPANLDLTPTYTSDNENIVTVDTNGRLTAHAEGSTTIKVNCAGSGDYNEADEVTINVIVSNKTPQAALTIDGNSTMKYGTTQTLRVSGGSNTGGAFTWTVNGPAILSQTSGTAVTLTPSGVGSATVTVTKAGNDTYADVTETFTIEIQPAGQGTFQITGSGVSNGRLTIAKDAVVELGTTGGSGDGAVTWTSSDPTKVSVDANGRITALKGGEATITATKAAQGGYSSATATLAVTVSRANRTLTIDSPMDTTPYGTSFSLSATPSMGGGDVTWTVTDGTGSAILSNASYILMRNGTVMGNPVTFIPTRAGTVSVTATISGDDDYNDATSETKTITITRVEPEKLEIYVPTELLSSGDRVQLSTTGGSENGTVTWSVVNGTGTATIDQNGKLTAGNAGTVTVKAIKSADMNYEASTADDKIVTIYKNAYMGNRDKTVMVKPGDLTEVDLTGLYPEGCKIGAPIGQGSIFESIEITANGKLAVKINSDTVEGDRGAVRIKMTDHPQYLDVDVSIYFEVTNKTIQQAAFAQTTVNKTYGDEDFSNALTGTVGVVAYESSDPSVAVVDADGNVTIRKPGTVSITATAEGDSEYANAKVSYTLNVAKKPLTISAVNRTAKIGDPKPTLGTVPGTDYTIVGLVGTDTLSNILVAYVGEPDMFIAGTSVITVSNIEVTNWNYYDVTILNGTLTVTNTTVTPVEPEPTPTPPSSEDTSTDRKKGDGSSNSNSNSNSSNTSTSTRPDGSTVTTKTSSNGTVTTTVEAADGTVSETVTSPNGATEVSVSLLGRGEDTVTLPISQVQPVLNSSMAQEINISVPSSRGTVTAEIPVQNVTAGTVAVLVAPDGTETIVKTSVPTANGIALSVSGNVTVKVIDNTKPFGDVVSSDWHKDAVDFVSARGLFNGTGANTFSPNGTMTRGMIATVLYNLEGNPAASGAASFPDVSSGDWFASAVQWASGTGLMSGYTNGSFGANDAITREQLAVILWAHAGRPAVSGTLSFSDAASVSDYAQQAMLWATQNGIIAGSNNTLTPGGSASRAQVAQMLMSYLKVYQQ